MNTMETTSLIAKLIVLAIIHWALVLVALDDLAVRQTVRGGHKHPWGLVVLLLPYFGSLAYMLGGRRFEEVPVLRREPGRDSD